MSLNIIYSLLFSINKIIYLAKYGLHGRNSLFVLIALLLIIITTALYEVAKHTKGSKREQAYRNARQVGWIKRVLNQLMRFMR